MMKRANPIKKTILTLLAVAAGLFGGACRQDDDGQADADEGGLAGEWALVEYTPSAMLPALFEYQKGEVTWSFDTGKNQVSIAVQSNAAFDLIANGAYGYTLGDNACNFDGHPYITIDGQAFGVLVLEGTPQNALTIDNGCVDGHKLVFAR